MISKKIESSIRLRHKILPKVLFPEMTSTKSYLPSAQDAPNHLPYIEIENYLMSLPELNPLTRQQYRSRLRSIRSQYDNTNHFMDIITVACKEKGFRTRDSPSPNYYKSCAMAMRKVIDFSWVKEVLHKHNLYVQVVCLIKKMRHKHQQQPSVPEQTHECETTLHPEPRSHTTIYYNNCTIIYNNTKVPVIMVDSATQT
jgi:hypothetical protein